MRRLLYALLLAAPIAGHADGMRCGNALITTGDNVLRVQHECGDPAYAAQYISYGTQLVFDPQLRLYSDLAMPVTVDEWTYNLGPTRFMRRLRFENGALVLIESLRYGF